MTLLLPLPKNWRLPPLSPKQPVNLSNVLVHLGNCSPKTQETYKCHRKMSTLTQKLGQGNHRQTFANQNLFKTAINTVHNWYYIVPYSGHVET